MQVLKKIQSAKIIQPTKNVEPINIQPTKNIQPLKGVNV